MDFYLKKNGIQTNLHYGDLCVSGNEDYGFRPFQLMVASIAGCCGSVLRKILEKQRVHVDDLMIHADVVRNSAEANRIDTITLRFTIKGYHLNPDRLEKSIATARRNCSMIRSVEDSITIKERLDTIELSR